MKFYRISIAMHPDEEMDYPCAVSDKISNADDLRLINRNNLPDFKAPFDYFELEFLTKGPGQAMALLEAYDFLGLKKPMWINHLINERLHEAFLNSKVCPQTRFYPAYLKFKGNKLNYFIIHSIYHYTADVDYDRSKFGYIKADHGDDHGKILQEFSVSNINDWKSKYETKPELTRFRPTILAMKAYYDAFLLETMPGWIVSQSLKDNLVNAKFQCFEFEEIQDVQFI